MGICPHLHALRDPTWPPAAPSEPIGLPEIHLQLCEDILIPKDDQYNYSDCAVQASDIFPSPNTSLSPPKVIQVQTASLTPYVKHLSHPVRRQDQHSMISQHVSGAAAGE